MIVHAGCIARWRPGERDGGWDGVLIEGPSGAGKSDLALRLIEQRWRLVSDDRTILWASGGRLFAACPPAIAGLVEARGLGIADEPALRLAPVRLVVRCLDPAEPIERLPEKETVTLCGVVAPVLQLHALQESAPAKMRRALGSIGREAQAAYQAAAVEPRGRGSR